MTSYSSTAATFAESATREAPGSPDSKLIIEHWLAAVIETPEHLCFRLSQYLLISSGLPQVVYADVRREICH